MIDIGVIVNNADMYTMALNVSKDYSLQTEVVLSNTYEKSLEYAKMFERKNCQILILRGGHSVKIRQANIDIPIIDIPFMGNNIATLLIQAKNDYGEFGVIGFDDLINTVMEWEKAMGNCIRYFRVKEWRDFESQIIMARDQGVNAIVGGYDACKFARELGLKCYCIETRQYEIESAFIVALKVLNILDRERKWNELFKTILDSIREGIISVNCEGLITHVNRSAKKILGTNILLKGRPLDVDTLNKKLLDVLNNGEKCYDKICEENDYMYTCSTIPITVDDKIVGGVAVLQEVEYVHKIENHIRRSMVKKGLFAKITFEDILGNSLIIKDIVKEAKQYSLVNSNLLIYGESGTGKEMFAQSIHNFGLRKEEPFIAINCATIQPNLLESELFGHVEGAFTGSKKGGKIGLFEVAHKGTIFLDEISEINIDVQARLLRVLEEKQIMRIGGDKIIPIDVRIIAATNKDLRGMVKKGEFREDLFYRLNVLFLRLPPLRERKKDLESLVESFLKYFLKVHNKKSFYIEPEGMDVLREYEWPGNVRELKNVIERLVVKNNNEYVGALEIISALGNNHFISQPILAHDNNKPYLGLKEQKEKELIIKVLNDTNWNKTEAAIRLGISRQTLYRKLNSIIKGYQN